VQIGALTGVKALGGGWYHGLALKADGTVLAWGDNRKGQLGDGTSTDRLLPVAVPGLTGVTALGGGCCLSMALKSDGSVRAWGNNETASSVTARRRCVRHRCRCSDCPAWQASGPVANTRMRCWPTAQCAAGAATPTAKSATAVCMHGA
jgi:hypothetical protein